MPEIQRGSVYLVLYIATLVTAYLISTDAMLLVMVVDTLNQRFGR